LSNTHDCLRTGSPQAVSYLPFVSNDLHEAKEIVARVLGSPKADFRTDPNNNCTLIFHASHQRGQNAVGRISELEVPETMSVRATTEAQVSAVA